MDQQKVDVKFGEWIQQGFNLYKENAVVLIVAALLAYIIGGATLGILIGPMLAGVFLIALRFLDKKEPKPEIGTVFKGFDYFLNSFLFFLVWGVLLAAAIIVLNFIPCVGQLLAIILALVAKTFLMFGLFLIVDRKMEFWPASMESINCVKSNFFPFLGFAVVALLIGAIGVIACGIGVVVTMPITVCILAVAYRDVFGKEPAPTAL